MTVPPSAGSPNPLPLRAYFTDSKSLALAAGQLLAAGFPPEALHAVFDPPEHTEDESSADHASVWQRVTSLLQTGAQPEGPQTGSAEARWEADSVPRHGGLLTLDLASASGEQRRAEALAILRQHGGRLRT